MTTINVTIVGRAIAKWEAIKKRSQEIIYKTYTKISAKRLRATTFAIARRAMTKLGAIEKSPI